MIRSMTGFGRAEKMIDGFNIKIQIRAINHRYGDVTVRLPRYCSYLEEKLRQIALRSISRGKVEINVNIEQQQDDSREVKLNEGIAKSYIDAVHELAKFGLKDDVTVSTICRYPDIFRVEHKELDEEQMLAMVSEVLTEALESLVQMREAEGERLEKDMSLRLENILKIVGLIEERTPQTVMEYREKLDSKIRDLLGNAVIDEQRLLTEVAMFADKIAVDEETVRLRSHVKEFAKTFKVESSIGKKMDFIVQEMNRETNTIGAKSNDIEISKYVVEMKSEIEKIREQVQNVE